MGREGAAGAPTGLHSRFSHTALAVYLTSIFALCCIGYDSTHVSFGRLPTGRGQTLVVGGHLPPPPRLTVALPARLFCCLSAGSLGLPLSQDIIQRSHINKKWFYLSGAPMGCR